MDDKKLNRRAAIRRLAAAGVGAVTSPLWVESLTALARAQAAHPHPSGVQQPGVTDAWAPKVLTGPQNETVATLCELIIPTTETPGARRAQVNRFIDGVLQEAVQEDRRAFLEGLAWMDRRSNALFGSNVLAATPEQQTELLTRLSALNSSAPEEKPGVDFFEALKSMTIEGY